MRETYWETDGDILYFNIETPWERYYVDFNNKIVKKQWRYFNGFEDGESVSFISFPPTLEELKEQVELDFKTSEIERKNEEQKLWLEVIEEENKFLEERNSWKKKLKGLINTKRLWEDMEEMEGWGINGIVEIEKTEERKPNYKEYECAYIKGDKNYLFMKHEPDFEVRYINHYYVWQQTGYLGDDYSGWMLYPLKDGKYLKISYNC